MTTVEDLIFVNFQWNKLIKVASFEEAEKDVKNGKPCISLRKNGATFKTILYNSIEERDADYVKVNDILMIIRQAYITNLKGMDGNGTKKTQAKTGLRKTRS